MTAGLTQLLRQPIAAPASGLWNAVAGRFWRWLARPKRRLGNVRLSEEWLRQHHIESSKHQDAW